MFLWKLYSLIPVTQTILYHPLNHQLCPVVFLPAGTLPPGLVTDILGYLQNEIVRFLHCWMRLIVSFPTTPTSTIFRAVFGLWCVLPLLSPPLHHSCLSFPVDGSIFDSAELQQVHLYPLRLATQASFALPSCSHWPLPHPSLLEALDRRYLGFEGVCSFGSCTH